MHQTERLVPKAVLIEQGLELQEVDFITDQQPTIEWHNLARYDGQLAVNVLTDEEFDAIAKLCAANGAPLKARTELVRLVWFLAQSGLPKGAWNTQELHSAVATGVLLKLAQDAWGLPADQRAAQESLDFRAKLGIAS